MQEVRTVPEQSPGSLINGPGSNPGEGSCLRVNAGLRRRSRRTDGRQLYLYRYFGEENDMSKIASHLSVVYSWFSGNPMCEQERTRRQIMLTLPDVRSHSLGI